MGAQVRLNFTLSVGEANTTVEVASAAESPLLATSAVVGGIVTGDEILHLPLIDQNAANLALTQAQFAGGIGGGVSVAGGSTMTLGTTVNGISVSNNRLDRAGGLLSFQLTQTVDMVEEVKVTSSPTDAENGRTLGSVSMIVRSGTNTVHGSVADGLRNTDLDANTFWNNFSQPLHTQANPDPQSVRCTGGRTDPQEQDFLLRPVRRQSPEDLGYGNQHCADGAGAAGHLPVLSWRNQLQLQRHQQSCG